MTITLTREEAQQVLDALEEIYWPKEHQAHKTIESLRARLAQPEPEPEHVATIGNWGKVMWREGVYPQFNDKLYTAPPQREWQGLTDEEKNEITWGKTVYEILDLAEAKLKEKNK